MNYTVTLLQTAIKGRARLPQKVQQQVNLALAALELDPRPPGSLKLKGRNEWRVRVGTYRIRYGIDDARREVTVTKIAHRKDVYDP